MARGRERSGIFLKLRVRHPAASPTLAPWGMQPITLRQLTCACPLNVGRARRARDIPRISVLAPGTIAPATSDMTAIDEHAGKYSRDDGRLALLCIATTAQYEADCSIHDIDVGTTETHSRDQDHRRQTPRFRGVNYEKTKGVWRARLYCKGQHTTIGRFPTAELAARAHDKAAVFVLGDRARTNFGVFAARAELERMHAEEAGRIRRPFCRLVALREAVRKEQDRSRSPMDEQQARSIRQAAAGVAFYGPAPTYFLDRMLRCDQDGRNNNGLLHDDTDGKGKEDGYSSSLIQFVRQKPVAMDAWKALVMAATRSAQTRGERSFVMSHARSLNLSTTPTIWGDGDEARLHSCMKITVFF